QPCLPVDAGERNDDRRHGKRLATRMTNTEIAQTLEAYAALLDLAGAGHYTVRAYRRAAELVRETRAPVAELVRAGRARELRGIGPGIERRLDELVATGRLAELEELEREVEPQLVALGRFVGLGPQRMVALGRSLGIRTADELGATVAGDVRRWRDVVYDLALVASSPEALERLERSPTVVAVVERDAGRA